ncbi:hypothetical protein SELMODRAFT_426718 [Selaginella moellendorffii]|uniref:Uncharacterized protein n=1 Tax=Selaginella moellendorffii TaxID=88036 RepID=D8SX97_SELML|nr:hypothetical protein SELMODRAFT_426718 [Selaginella moellendorffii]
MVELCNSSWKHSGRVNWENEDLHTITGLLVIHMLLAEDQGGQNWSKPRVREIACPSNGWPGFFFQIDVIRTYFWVVQLRTCYAYLTPVYGKTAKELKGIHLRFEITSRSSLWTRGQTITLIFESTIASATKVLSLHYWDHNLVLVIGASNEQMRVFGHLWATASSNLMVTLVYVYCPYLLDATFLFSRG